MEIEYLEELPSKDEFCELFSTTGWYQEHNLTDDHIYGSAKNSYYFVAARLSKLLIGCGRIISDGHVHALIVDMIVHPDYQGKGIGKKILDMLIERCKRDGIIDIQLFSAKDKAGFYLKNGFKHRPDDAPGMQYVYDK